MATKRQSSPKPKELLASNYCLGFIDLLGQRDAVKGQRLVPTLEDPEAYNDAFRRTLKGHIGRIRSLQNQADTFLKPFAKPNRSSTSRKSLPKELRSEWDELQRARIVTQRWSDGLAIFSSLVEEDIECPTNALFGILSSCGNFCLLGLSFHQPVRGAIDVAWGVELHPGELYGPVVAHAYELESKVARYPRIVVGSTVIHYLISQRDRPADSRPAMLNKSVAELCLGMCTQDHDGQYIIHYLGDAFKEAVSYPVHGELYGRALKFVKDQLQLHYASKNSKLSSRYRTLLTYFEAHPT